MKSFIAFRSTCYNLSARKTYLYNTDYHKRNVVTTTGSKRQRIFNSFRSFGLQMVLDDLSAKLHGNLLKEERLYWLHPARPFIRGPHLNVSRGIKLLPLSLSFCPSLSLSLSHSHSLRFTQSLSFTL